MNLTKLTLSVMFLNVMVLGLSNSALSHSTAITECRDNIVYDEAVLVESWMQQGTGFWAEGYDTTGSGTMDVVALSHITGTEEKLGGRQLAIYHNPNPVFWLVDRLEFDDDGDGLPDRVEHDGVPDYVFIDKKGDGVCSDIQLYEDLTIPHMEDTFGQGEEVL